MTKKHLRTSRQRYLAFVDDYKHHRLDDAADAAGKKRLEAGVPADAAAVAPATNAKGPGRAKRREYIHEYLRWLKPHRFTIGAVFLFALITAGVEMIQPLFMRFIIDRVLLNATLDSATRLLRLNLAGAAFLGVVVFSSLIGVLKDYRQRLLNTRVMLSLRRSLFERLLHLPLPTLWEMKTGGILSRLTGDVETTTGLLQMAVVSPSVSVIRLVIAVGVLMTLGDWH